MVEVRASMQSIMGAMDMEAIIHHEEAITGHNHMAEMEGAEEVGMGEEAVEGMEVTATAIASTVIVVCLSADEAIMASQAMGDLLLGHPIHHHQQATMVAQAIVNTKAVHPTVITASKHLPLTMDIEVGEVDMGPTLSRKDTAETLAMEEGALATDMEATGTLVAAGQVMEAMGAMGAIEAVDRPDMEVLEAEVVVEVVMANRKDMVVMDVEVLPVLTMGGDVVMVGIRRCMKQYRIFCLCTSNRIFTSVLVPP